MTEQENDEQIRKYLIAQMATDIFCSLQNDKHMNEDMDYDDYCVSQSVKLAKRILQEAEK